MPNFFESIGKVEPCDGRDLLQKLTYLVVSEVAKKKGELCSNIENAFADFGLDNFSPCQLLNQTTLDRLLNGDTDGVINYLLTLRDLPPHTIKILRDGYKSLSDIEKSDLDKYLQSKAVNYVRGQIEPVVQEFIAEKVKCPDEETTKRLRLKIENTVRVVNNLQDKITRLDSIVVPASATVSALNAAFQAADKVILGLDITLPATAASFSGASGLVARVISKLERFIDNNKDNVQKLDDNLCNAAKAIRFAKTQLQIVQTLLQILDVLLRACLIKKGEEASTLLEELTPITFERNRQPIVYRGYTLEIREDLNNAGIAPRRFAVALDPVGVVILQGVPSFSSSTEVLLEELKFRIDNQLG